MKSIQLRSTSTFTIENGIKVVVYGRAGMGKTLLCSTAPSPVIFSAESGLMTLRQFNLPYYEIRSVGDLRDAYTWSRTSHEARQFQTICLDSISDIAETLLASLKLGKKDPRQAYGEMIDQMVQVLKDFRDLPGKHVYMAAKQARIQNQLGVVLNGPSMPGQKLGEALPYLPDLVFQADRDPTGNFYFLRTQADYANDAKDRSGVLNPMEEPHLGKIFDKITHGGRSQ